MKPATSEIKPCPHCGAYKNSWINVGRSTKRTRCGDLTSYVDGWQTVCLKCGACGACGPWADSRDEAIELWNQRVGDQE